MALAQSKSLEPYYLLMRGKNLSNDPLPQGLQNKFHNSVVLQASGCDFDSHTTQLLVWQVKHSKIVYSRSA